MSLPEVVRVDPFDEQAFDAWHACYLAADRYGRERWASPWALEEFRVEKQAVLPHRESSVYGLALDGRFVAVAELAFSLLDNLGMAEVLIHTHPEHRRQGHGSRVLAHLEDVARARGRSSLWSETPYPFEAGAHGAGEPGPEFLRSRGFRFGLADVMRVADLPVDRAVLDRLCAEAAPRHAAYELRSFVGAVPEELALGVAEAAASLNTEAPTGELEIEAQTSDVAALRAEEAILEGQRRRKYTTVAVAPDGSVAGYTELLVPDLDPSRVYQWGTLVRPGHRGHRLGLALKAGNLCLVQERERGRDLLVTYNAEVNTHMIGVNDALGFRPVERLGEFQKQLT